MTPNESSNQTSERLPLNKIQAPSASHYHNQVEMNVAHNDAIGCQKPIQNITSSIHTINPSTKKLVPSRKFLVRLAIGLLVLTAVAGIVAILFSGLGSAGLRIFLTAGEIFAAAVLCLCFTGKTTSRQLARLQVFGFLSAAVAMLYGSYLIWVNYSTFSVTWPDHVYGVASIIAIACAQACVLLPMMSCAPLIKKLIIVTLLAILGFSGMVIYLFFGSSVSSSDEYLKVLGILLILDVLGTVLVPVLRHFTAQVTPTDLKV